MKMKPLSITLILFCTLFIQVSGWAGDSLPRLLPQDLFDEPLKTDMTGFRKFRHVLHHAYGFLLDWNRLIVGIERVEYELNL